jgi:hypothetical protein
MERYGLRGRASGAVCCVEMNVADLRRVMRALKQPVSLEAAVFHNQQVDVQARQSFSVLSIKK